MGSMGCGRVARLVRTVAKIANWPFCSTQFCATEAKRLTGPFGVARWASRMKRTRWTPVWGEFRETIFVTRRMRPEDLSCDQKAGSAEGSLLVPVGVLVTAGGSVV